jgi:hypothetical protein
MNKTVYAGAGLIALALLAGSLFIPGSFVMTLASSSVAANVARIVIIGLMIGLIITNPPRSRVFRTALGVASVGFLGYAWNHAMSGTIQLADSILYLQAAIAFAIEALETRVPVTDAEEEQPTQIPVNLLGAASRGL